MKDKKPKIRLDELIDLAIGMTVVTAFVGACLFCDDTRNTTDKVVMVVLYIGLWVLLYFQYKS